MNKIYASMDEEGYWPGAPGDLVLSGWCASPDPVPIEIQVLAEGSPVAFREERGERPDVIQNVEELSGISPDVGFTLTIPSVDRLWEERGSLQVVALQGQESQVIWEKSGEELKRGYGSRTMRYKLDVVRPRDGQILLRGWVVDVFGEEKIYVVDEHKQPIRSRLEKSAQNDLVKTWGLDGGHDYGFEVTIREEDVPGNWIVLVLENHLTQKICRIDLKKMYYRHSRWGRLVRALRRERMEKNRAYIRKFGVAGFCRQIWQEADPYSDEEHRWLKRHSAGPKELLAQRGHIFAENPLISIVIPLYNTPLEYLEAVIDSIRKQTYRNWELCLADGSADLEARKFIREKYRKDSRIRYRKLKENRGISGNTNAAVDMAKGEFLMLCDHDDIVASDALFEMVSALNEDSQVDIVYTDEDKVSMDGKFLYEANFKPDFNLDLLRSSNYICHIFLVRRSLVDEVGKFRSEYDGSQDYDFILRCCEQARKIHHVPRSLYHWRAHPASTAGDPASKQYAYRAGEAAIRAHYQRLGIQAEVSMTEYPGRYRTVFPVKGEPKVSILIPNKDHVADLKRVTDSIYEKSTYSNFEILILENGSTEEQTFAFYEKLKEEHENLRVIVWEKEFNYSAINNFGAEHAEGEYLLFLNNDIEIITPDWMEEMLGYCQREDVGACGAKLLYPDGRVQHAGVVIGLGGPAGHILYGAKNQVFSYVEKVECTQDLSAVTAACMMMPKEVFQKAGGFDEKLKVAYNDVDLCLKVRELGLLVVYNAFVEAYHYESASRGAETDDPLKEKRWKEEISRFENKWRKILEEGDPYYNVNLALDRPDCRLRRGPDDLPPIDEVFNI